MGKVFSPKAINMDTFRLQMTHILQVMKLVCIEAIGDNIFILDFTSDIDQRHSL